MRCVRFLYSIAPMAVYPYSLWMLFSVVETHHQGVRLSRDEIRAAEPVLGQLEISDWLEGTVRLIVRKIRLDISTWPIACADSRASL